MDYIHLFTLRLNSETRGQDPGVTGTIPGDDCGDSLEYKLVTVLLMSLVPGLGLQHPEPQQCRQHQADGPLPVSAGEAQAG